MSFFGDLLRIIAIGAFFVATGTIGGLAAGALRTVIGLGGVVANYLGNLIDRLRLGYVVDFVHVYWREHQWPDFNAADSAITIGVTLLVLDILRSPHAETSGKTEIVASPAARTE